MSDIPDVTVEDWQSVCLSKCRELLDYFSKKISMSRFAGFSEKSLFKKKKCEIWVKKSMGSVSDAITLNFSKELDPTDCSMRVFEILGF